MNYYVEKFIEESWHRFAQNDTNTSYLRFEAINREQEGIGPGAHQTVATHRKMADMLIQHIETIEAERENF
jgi:hypothetical protein